MTFKSSLLTTLLFLGAASAAQAAPGQPNFMPALYGDGDVWGTKFAAAIPGPNDHNGQSFDGLYIIRNHPDGQLPVSEAAPGNPAYNGGRWNVNQVYWTADGFMAYGGDVPVLMSFDEILYEESLGHVLIVAGTFEGGPPQYFLCPMLPVK